MMNNHHHSITKTVIAPAVAEATPSKAELEAPSSPAETDTSKEDNDHTSWVEELDTIKSNKWMYEIRSKKWLYAGLYFLVLLILAGIVYFFFGGATQSNNNGLPLSTSMSHHPEDDSNKSVASGDSQDDVVFIPSIAVDIDNKVLERSDFALVDKRSSLSNTFLRQMQIIEQHNRIHIRSSGKGHYLQQQEDGNLVVYPEGQAVFWSTGVVQTPSSDKRFWTVLQDDGNMVTYSRKGNGKIHVAWASNSISNIDNYNLVLTPNRDGLMIVRRNNGQIIWSTVAVAAASGGGGNPNPPSNNNNNNNNNNRVTYTPGKLNRRENGLLLSEGLRSRIVAQTGQKVVLDGKGNNKKSSERFHAEPDGAAVFADDKGGWVYVSNSEVKEPRGRGGVGAIYFDKHARTTDYRMIQRGTTANCSGGKTPWNTWVSCEETDNGRVFQIDPFGKRGMQEMTMDRGAFEAFAYDIRDQNHPRFFVTEDHPRGAMRRFSPSQKNWNDPWQLLHAPGTLQYLVLEPRGGGGRGTFRWTTDKGYARQNAQMYYPLSEGIDVYRNQLFFTVKERKQLFILDLDRNTYERQSTRSGAFDGMPDQVKRIIGDDNSILYFCEEAGGENGVHGRDPNGWFFTILESDTFRDETTGLAFSPNGKRMYVSFQSTGKIYDIWREDGLPFHGQTLNVRYH